MVCLELLGVDVGVDVFVVWLFVGVEGEYVDFIVYVGI